MRFPITTPADDTQRALGDSPPGRTLRHVTRFAAASGLTVATGLALALRQRTAVTASGEATDVGCNNRTLRGEFGFLVSGVRGIGPGATETFVAVGQRTYDGHGGVVDTAIFHGQVTGVQGDGQTDVSGTYEVNADCTGTSTVFVPTLPFPIVSRFVIVDNGRQIKEIVVSPLTNIVTATFDRNAGPATSRRHNA